jgi:hypothetical protein
MMRRQLAIALFSILGASFNYEAAAEPRVAPIAIYQSNSTLKDQVKQLTEALNKRDLDVIKSQIAPSRIYVEVSDRAGAYLSNSQTLVVMETFLRSRTAVNAAFEFVSDDGVIGSASGSLTARKDGRIIRYRLNFGFVKQTRGNWQLNRISMR